MQARDMEPVESVAYLAGCAVRGDIPNAEQVQAMDLDATLRLAARHTLSACVCMALESAGHKNARTSQTIAKAMRKTALFEDVWAQIRQRLDEAEIWHLPLKGAVLRNEYPRYGMREMADYDILCDPTRMQDVRDIMEDLGFSTESFGKGNHDVYHKQPVLNFEMHARLFGASSGPALRDYYRDVEDRLVSDGGFARRFTPEDFYVYLVAHEHKHYAGGGTGLRSFLDAYVYLRKHGEALDMPYIAGEVAKLGIADFERASRSLALHLFGAELLTDDDREMLAYVTRSGTYGTTENRVENGVREQGGGVRGKLRYAFRRLFLPPESLEAAYPLVYRHRVLVPLLPIFRLGRGLLFRRRRVAGELRALFRMR